MVKHHIAIFMYGLSGGGVPRRNITLANALAARGHRVDLLVIDGRGELRRGIAPAVRISELGGVLTRLPWIRSKRRRQFYLATWALGRFLAREKPSVLLSADNYANLTALRARSAAGVRIPIAVSQRNHTSTYAARNPRLIAAIQRVYPEADAIVAVSRGVGDDLVALGLPSAKIETIYNPVVDDALVQAAKASVDHPWFGDGGAPVIVAAGRIDRQKDFPTLIRAFASMRRAGVSGRLVIFGDGRTPRAKQDLLQLADELGVAEDVSCPGYVVNAVPYIARADLLVLSSQWEGLGAVVIEALACGVPVVSTDCPSGPAEILAGGEYGWLTPVGDAGALAVAMKEALQSTPCPERLKARAQHFTTEEATRRYLDLFDRLTAPNAAG